MSEVHNQKYAVNGAITESGDSPPLSSCAPPEIRPTVMEAPEINVMNGDMDISPENYRTNYTEINTIKRDLIMINQDMEEHYLGA